MDDTIELYPPLEELSAVLTNAVGDSHGLIVLVVAIPTEGQDRILLLLVDQWGDPGLDSADTPPNG